MIVSHPFFRIMVGISVTCLLACRPTGTADDHPRQSTQVQEVVQMKVATPAFDNGDTIPAKYTGVGEDISPPLMWSTPPDGTKSIALICDDPDAPSRARPRPEGPWVHWVIYNIPASIQTLPEGIPRVPEPKEPAGAKQGKNDFPTDNIGYRGPMPPPGSGPHRYFFKVYALDCELDLDPAKTTKAKLLKAMDGHVLGEGQLMGVFERR